MKLTTTLTDDAGRYLKTKLKGRRTGSGAILSSLLLAERAREEGQCLPQEPPSGAWQVPTFGKIRQHHER